MGRDPKLTTGHIEPKVSIRIDVGIFGSQNEEKPWNRKLLKITDLSLFTAGNRLARDKSSLLA
jgi:hypothetical protein